MLLRVGLLHKPHELLRVLISIAMKFLDKKVIISNKLVFDVQFRNQ
jgi:hypothetical protein